MSELFPSLVDLPDSPFYGLQVRGSRFLEAVDTRLPLVVYALGGGGNSISDAITRLYPPDQPCFVLPGSGDQEYRPREHRARDLAAALASANATAVLLVPPSTI